MLSLVAGGCEQMSCIVLRILENRAPAELLTILCVLAVTRRGSFSLSMSRESWHHWSNTASFVVLGRSAIDGRLDKH